MMSQMNFGTKWSSWIRGCLESATSSILGLEGDPLSPFLFIMVMEGLNVAMKEALSKGIFNGISIPASNSVVSHLFYADDTFFIGECSRSNIANLARILRCFYVSSGLKVNFEKSKVFGMGADSNEVDRWASPLCCEPSILPFTYIGVHVGANMNLKAYSG